MKPIEHLRESVRNGTIISQNNTLAVARFGAPMHLAFFFLFKYGFQLPYENFFLRVIASMLCLSALFRAKVPRRLEPYMPVYWHLSIIFALPFIFTVHLLMNNFHELWLYWEIFMVFVLIAFVPNWLLFLVDLSVGVLGATAFYALSTPHPVLHPEANMAMWWLVVAFSIVAGYVFSYSNWQSMKAEELRKAEEKYAALEGLAGGIAHEMRNPLGQISHSLEEIVQGILPSRYDESAEQLGAGQIDAIRRRVTRAQNALNRGLHVIDITLENFKGQQHLPHRDFSSVSIASATRKAIDEYGYASEEERRKIHLEADNDFIFRGDETNYMFVLYNLFINALYVLQDKPDGRIDVRFESDGERNRVVVRDNGTGIPPEIIDKIFDPLFTSGKKGGTGLGLAFCRRVMQSFGGEITCSSETGSFTEFVLWFPALDKELIEEFGQRLYAESRSLLSGKQILLAGNDPQDLARIRRKLEPLGMRIDEATDGNSAMYLVTTKRFDLVIAEIGLAGLDAPEIAARITSQGKEIPLVAYAKDKHPAVVREVKEASGIEIHISMPPELSELLLAIKTALETSRKALMESLAGKSVLVVDDLDFNRKVIKSMLKRLDVTTREAGNGLEALELLENNRFDLLVMDMQMPLIDGCEASRLIRSSGQHYHNIPILGLTGNLDSKAMQEAKLSGMNDCLMKPVKMKLFLRKVSSLLKNRQTAERSPEEETAPGDD